MKTVLHIIKKEFLQFWRDPKMVALIFISPVIQLIFLGYAANFDVKTVHTAVFDLDRTETSRNYVRSFTGSDYFEIDYYVTNYKDLQKLIDEGKILFGLVIAKDFEKNINRNLTAHVQAVFDGSDGNSASIAAGYVQLITADFANNILVDFINRTGLKTVPASVSPEVRVWYNPAMTTRNFMVPGIVALLLMNITLILTSLAIVKEKEIGTLEQLIVTPIKSGQLILGKLIPFALLGFLAEIFVLTAMAIIFGIEVRGSVPFLFFTTFLYILSTLGLGMFVSTISKTQQQAMMLAIFVVMMPMIYLSGFAFPIENMPVLIQYVTYLIPLRYFMVIIRGVILKGIGFTDLWQETLVLAIIGISIIIFSSLKFRKKLD